MSKRELAVLMAAGEEVQAVTLPPYQSIPLVIIWKGRYFAYREAHQYAEVLPYTVAEGKPEAPATCTVCYHPKHDGQCRECDAVEDGRCRCVAPRPATPAPATECACRKALDLAARCASAGVSTSAVAETLYQIRDKLTCECAGLREAVAWAYQAIGARWPNSDALDNLSALSQGDLAPHEWPVVPPLDSDSELAELRVELEMVRTAAREQAAKLRAQLAAANERAEKTEAAKRAVSLEREVIAKYWVRFQQAALKVGVNGAVHSYDCHGVAGSCKCGLDDLKEAARPLDGLPSVAEYLDPNYKTEAERQLRAQLAAANADLAQARGTRDRAQAASTRDVEARRCASTPWYLENRVGQWVICRIGPLAATRKERALRILEEAIELAQSEGVKFTQVYAQAKHVYSRRAGEPAKEAAGLATCLFAYCAVIGERVLDLAIAEIERNEAAKPQAEIEASLARKRSAGLLSEASGGGK